MTDRSSIEWTDATWNPIRGCARVSAGCMNCYAERVAARFSGPGQPYEGLTARTTQGPKWTGKVHTVPELLDQPLRWVKPRRIFVNSMSDLFHEDVPDEFIDKVFAVMGTAPWHTFQVLTKRPKRMLDWFNEKWQPAPEWSQRERHELLQTRAKELGINRTLPEFQIDKKGEDRFDQVYAAWEKMTLNDLLDANRFWTADGQSHLMANPWPLPNVWLGVSVEDQAAADERIPLLLQTPAAVRWISAEPLLGPVSIFHPTTGDLEYSSGNDYAPGSIDWVVAGGESGPGARPVHPDWIRSLRDQCASAHDGVPFFFKQWGEWRPMGNMYADDVDATADWEREGGRSVELLSRNGTRWGRERAQPPLDTEYLLRLGKRQSGRRLDGRTHDEYPA